MDIITILQSVNKITLTAFIITLGVLIYEIYHMRKDKTVSASKPVIPTFEQTNGTEPIVSATPIVMKESEIKKNPYLHKIIFAVLVILLILFGFLSVASLNTIKNNASKPQGEVVVQEVQSSGIKIFNSNWQEIIGEKTDILKTGNTVYVGIAMVKGSDIDKARIKINSGEWTTSDITAEYNNQFNVFYKRYIIKENETKLEIEAQLYSKSKGWLSE